MDASNKRLTFGSLILLASLLACAKPDQASPRLPRMTASDPSYSQKAVRTTEPSAQLAKLLSDSQISCDGACPPAVGRVIYWSPSDEKGFIDKHGCTGYLVASDIVMTNSHCIPDEVKADPTICPQVWGIKFPAIDRHSVETLTCAELIKASEIPKLTTDANGRKTITPDKPDYAFVRVNRVSGRAPLVIARDGVPDGTPLVVYAADPLGDENFSAIIRKKTCTSKQLRFGQYMHDFSKIIWSFGPDCNVVQGDSGAPALDANHQVSSIYFAANDWMIDEVRALIAAKKYLVPTINPDWKHNAFFTNLSCIDFPKSVGAPPKSSQCSNLANLDKDANEKYSDFEIEERAVQSQKDFDEWIQQRPAVFYVTASKASEKMDTTFSFNLKCLQPQNYWPGLNPAPTVNGNELTVKYKELVTTHMIERDPEYRTRQKKVSEKVIQHEIVINISEVKDVDSIVGTHKIDGVKSPFSTHWCNFKP